MGSLIEWTNKTWNPTTGCSEVSRGCTNCYAKEISQGNHKMGVSGYDFEFNLTLHHDRLGNPKEWASPQFVFVNSMSDLFHERVPEDFIFEVFETMNKADHHVYQVLTKRSERLRQLGPYLPWGQHIWMGVSVEDQDAKYRIDDLRESEADVKWISAEPLTGDLGEVDLSDMDWVVMGGESGDVDEIKEVDPDWMRSLIRQCRSQDVTPFVKQMGEIWATKNDASDRHGGHILDWPQDLRVREVPEVVPNQPSLTEMKGIESI
jgi:protein gp37